jgi:hypothetical protein
MDKAVSNMYNIQYAINVIFCSKLCIIHNFNNHHHAFF